MNQGPRAQTRAAREAARAAGANTYRPAIPCERGHYERYLAGGGCVACMKRRRVADPQRIAALAAGLKTYVPAQPCMRGHMERYAGSGMCVQCAIARATEARLKQPGVVERQEELRENRRRRAAAKAMGLLRYVSTHLCPQGHKERYVFNAGCVACHNEQSLARYHRRRCEAA